jgi:hypothetical protein
MKLKYYHTTGTKFKVGDIFGGPGKLVCLSTSPIPHGTIQSIVTGGFSSYKEYSAAHLKVINQHWDDVEKWLEIGVGDRPVCPKTINPKPVSLTVYEVKPFVTPIWVGANDEYRLYDEFVEVIRIVGNAKGILDNHINKFGETAKAWHFGGKAIKNNKPRKGR